ncbi:protein arginine kinase [Candidatus Methylacidiphilum fumarolicum]|uniref:Protein-arginine kinase n=2 Tax=Methylacidiphilum (ex Ratnadevi et al. 2023) TaxID=511745 RepID=A0A0C1V5H9_9BACT|nr:MULTISPECIES: protein arginine kinase [Methylacidiphilum (ex Ratnadevi et al. 2023)]KIE58995.1 ATP:guanido phosphotransferase [Methylacidiphilum kamchatkense Kam1]MBW6414110.1 protein arginine kinase [Candidatus Methylacidiphilum fumarolicum]QDQ43117.1 protein arginine kinase [Methylacidiphilum kamchatkense Kam1]TFE66486.1 protein arginine kinase [Candidatus Methylacidiphilum fumarolicum]TFE75311.1 protein arginine kinase [Candidatus Methylacidiphilum fumarolicum]
MKINSLISSPSEWLHSGEGNNKIVVSSRVRIARNLNRFPFPGWARKNERIRILSITLPEVSSLGEMKPLAIVDSMDRFSPLEKQVLVEEHLISREHAAKNVGSGLAVNSSRSVSIMINEEDHLRIQTFKSGLQLKAAWKLAEKIDDELDEKLEFAFSTKLGYLTACPTNVGTGLRVSAMMHLPALVLSEQISQIVKAVNRIGLAVRGLFGEGTEALGNLFQISNQMTLGESEEEILERLHKVITQIIQHEENARQKLLQEKPKFILDQVSRAFGILQNSYIITSKETLNLLSVVRLGIDLGMFPENYRMIIDECLIKIQPAHLQMAYERKLSSEERDQLRADFLREKFKNFPSPDTRHLQFPYHH